MIKERLDPKILAMYIGSECMCDGERFTLKGVMIDNDSTTAFNGRYYSSPLHNDIPIGWWVENCDFKLLLRPLSDMTDAEKEEVWYGPIQKPGVIQMDLTTGMCYKVSLTPQRVHWFASRHFDIFGLIEAGHAIPLPK